MQRSVMVRTINRLCKNKRGFGDEFIYRLIKQQADCDLYQAMFVNQIFCNYFRKIT
jgi:hypothetical protein